MAILLILLELFVGTLAVWVLTFEVALYGEISIKVLSLAFLVLWILFIASMARYWLRRMRLVGRQERAFARDVIIFGCLVGLMVLVISRPDADDGSYMHQLLVDASTPGDSFTADPFYVPFRGKQIVIPLLSENEVYEAMVVVFSKLTGIGPMQAYHNIFAFLGSIMWIITYTALFRRFRVPGNRVWLALLAVVVFVLIDGNLHRSFGNFTLIRIWQGKVVALAVLLPAFTLFSLRFLAQPTVYRCALICITGAVSFFINRSSVVVLAVLGAAISISYCLAFRRNRRRRNRAMVLVAAVTPMWVLGAGVAFFSLPPDSTLSSLIANIFSSKASSPNQLSWWSSLYVAVLGSPLILFRDILLLVVLPFLVVRRPLNTFLPLLSLSVAALAMSPLTGPIWCYLTTVVYWRLYFALPLPLCAGLFACLVFPSPLSKITNNSRRFALAGIMILVTGAAVEQPVFSPANGVQLKLPFEYRFRREALAFARSAAPLLDGKLVLAAEEIAVIFALTEFESIDLVYVRTISAGSVLARAKRAISFCRITKRTSSGVGTLLNRGVDAVIMPPCDEKAMRRLRELLPNYRLEKDESFANASFHLYWVRRRN